MKSPISCPIGRSNSKAFTTIWCNSAVAKSHANSRTERLKQAKPTHEAMLGQGDKALLQAVRFPHISTLFKPNLEAVRKSPNLYCSSSWHECKFIAKPFLSSAVKVNGMRIARIMSVECPPLTCKQKRKLFAVWLLGLFAVALAVAVAVWLGLVWAVACCLALYKHEKIKNLTLKQKKF